MRWGVIAGQTAVLVAAQLLLQIELPLAPAGHRRRRGGEQRPLLAVGQQRRARTHRRLGCSAR
ncbi:MAG: hypothetical protein U0802_17925 [Candidatus Binatia bacterium]